MMAGRGSGAIRVDKLQIAGLTGYDRVVVRGDRGNDRSAFCYKSGQLVGIRSSTVPRTMCSDVASLPQPLDRTGTGSGYELLKAALT
jgi:hypothetical protein